jgi:BlaI family transcriptional regulator, penicillinase repressor
VSKQELPKLTNPELEIMKAVWSHEAATIPDVLDIINKERKRKLKRSTIQVQMTRLEKKGWVTHTEENRTYYYRATICAEEASSNIAKDFTKRVFDGSCSQLIRALFSNTTVKIEEIQELRNLLNSFKGE